jgi:phosphoserine phosphatase RsbU/P
VLLCVADVSGKGLPASLLMSHTQATLRALLGRAGSLQDLTGCANTLLHGSSADNKYVTAALLELAPASGKATYVSAGHINSLHVGGDGTVRRLESTGPPLGLLPMDAPYERSSITIAPGECIVLCSDGVTDAQNQADEEFGEARLAEIIVGCRHASASEMVSKVVAAIDDFAGAAPQFDDITLMVVKRAL